MKLQAKRFSNFIVSIAITALLLTGAVPSFAWDTAWAAEPAFAAETDQAEDAGSTVLPAVTLNEKEFPELNGESGIVLDIDWSTEENLKAIRKYVEEHPEKEAYIGNGYAEFNFDEHGPSKKLLDEICSDKPMMILGSGGHEGWVNSKALELAGPGFLNIRLKPEAHQHTVREVLAQGAAYGTSSEPRGWPVV